LVVFIKFIISASKLKQRFCINSSGIQSRKSLYQKIQLDYDKKSKEKASRISNK
ncbi:1032_t:CDS:1, partial [Funneliformis geosporum]